MATIYFAAPLTRQTVLAKGADPLPVAARGLTRANLLLNTEYGGDGTIRGTVERKSDPVNTLLRRRVRLYTEQSGALVAETWSDAKTGAYIFRSLDVTQRYTVIAYDYEHNYRAEAADNLTPEVLP